MTQIPTSPAPALQWRDGETTHAQRTVAEEMPIGISYDGRPHAVLMATPQDAEDLALGFTISERVATFGQILDVSVEETDEGLLVDIALSPDARKSRAQARGRTLEGRSSCGLCGVQRLAQAVRPLPRLTGGPVVTRAALHRALAALEEAQELGRLTRAMHAAAWVSADGRLELVREDVGRHNALDKVIGAAAQASLDPVQAFIVITSRCSYEMVEKAAMAGITLLAAISAPTALAIRKAEEANMTLVALARADGHMVFTGHERLTDDLAEAAE